MMQNFVQYPELQDLLIWVPAMLHYGFDSEYRDTSNSKHKIELVDSPYSNSSFKNNKIIEFKLWTKST